MHPLTWLLGLPLRDVSTWVLGKHPNLSLTNLYSCSDFQNEYHDKSVYYSFPNIYKYDDISEWHLG